MIKISRIYDSPKGKGFRVLVDRLWPRGINKENAGVNLWLKEIAPSNELRKWFGHDPQRWTEFKMKYFQELEEKKELVDQIIEKAKAMDVVLLYGSKDIKYNNAVALKEYLKLRKAEMHDQRLN
jgi:uncharacterized protein YeaO (DUF488 family)